MYMAIFFYIDQKKTNAEYNFFKYCITKNGKLKTKLKLKKIFKVNSISR